MATEFEEARGEFEKLERMVIAHLYPPEVASEIADDIRDAIRFYEDRVSQVACYRELMEKMRLCDSIGKLTPEAIDLYAKIEAYVEFDISC